MKPRKLSKRPITAHQLRHVARLLSEFKFGLKDPTWRLQWEISGAVHEAMNDASPF